MNPFIGLSSREVILTSSSLTVPASAGGMVLHFSRSCEGQFLSEPNFEKMGYGEFAKDAISPSLFGIAALGFYARLDEPRWSCSKPPRSD